MRLQRPPLIASLFLLLSLTILGSLGTWQLQRLAWKTDLLARIDAAYAGESLLLQGPVSGDLHLTRAAVTGRYLHADSILLAPRVHNGQLGAHLMTPLQRESGEIVLVNRGWVAEGQDIDLFTPDSGAERVRVSGLVRLPDAPNRFTPENNPETEEWYHTNITEIAAHFGLSNVAPLILFAESTEDPRITAHTDRPQLNNNHLYYAWFWYSLAGVLIVIFALRFIAQPI